MKDKLIEFLKGPIGKRLLLTAVAGALIALANVPELAPVRDMLLLVSGLLGGGAHIKRPGDDQ